MIFSTCASILPRHSRATNRSSWPACSSMVKTSSATRRLIRSMRLPAPVLPTILAPFPADTFTRQEGHPTKTNSRSVEGFSMRTVAVILTQLLQSQDAHLQGRSRFSVLLRGQDRAAKLAATYGDRTEPILYESMDDSERAEEVASQHDIIVINCDRWLSSHLCRCPGQGSRWARGSPTLLIHTSGTFNVCDLPLSGRAFPNREFDDENGTTVHD